MPGWLWIADLRVVANEMDTRPPVPDLCCGGLELEVVTLVQRDRRSVDLKGSDHPCGGPGGRITECSTEQQAGDAAAPHGGADAELSQVRRGRGFDPELVGDGQGVGVPGQAHRDAVPDDLIGRVVGDRRQVSAVDQWGDPDLGRRDLTRAVVVGLAGLDSVHQVQ